MTPVRTAARGMLAAIFVSSGLNALAAPRPLAERSRPVTDRVGSVADRAGLPLPRDAESLVQLNAVAQLAGGAMLLTRHLSRPGAALLAASLVPTTMAGHPFWKYPDPAERRVQRTHFLKNLGLLGGALLAAVDTEGRPGLSWRAGRLAERTQRTAARAARTARRETRRAARTARRETRLAVRSASIGRRLAG